MAKTSTFNISTLVRENILKMKPYSSARDEFKGEAEMFLDANENPYPSPYNRYPDPLQWEVKQKLAKLKPVKPEQIFLGNGSDEAIDLLIRAFCEPYRDSILITEPTYGMYAVCAEVNAVNIKTVLLAEDYALDLKATLAAIDDATRIIFLCSPNNPTAATLNRKDVKTIIESFQGLVVVDEAYIDFSQSGSWLTELSALPNLVVLQTFSKAWGLAGLRCGMAYASEEIIGILNRIKYPYNINIKTQELVLAALDNSKQKDVWVKEILEQRSSFMKALAGLPVVEKVFPSDANFVLVRITGARKLYEFLMEQKIIVRDRSKVTLCENCLRITIGTPQENQLLLKAIKTYQPKSEQTAS